MLATWTRQTDLLVQTSLVQELSGGAKTGIVVIVLVLVMLIGAFITTIRTKRRNRRLTGIPEEPSFDPRLQPNPNLLACFWLLNQAEPQEEGYLIAAWLTRWIDQGRIVLREEWGEKKLYWQENQEPFRDEEAEAALFRTLIEAAQNQPPLLVNQWTAWINRSNSDLRAWLIELYQAAEQAAIACGYVQDSSSFLRKSTRLTESGQKSLLELYSMRMYLPQHMDMEHAQGMTREMWFRWAENMQLINLPGDSWADLMEQYPGSDEAKQEMAEQVEIARYFARAMNTYTSAERAELRLKRPNEYALPPGYKDGIRKTLERRKE